MKPVSIERYKAVAMPHMKEKSSLWIEGWQIAALHGAIRLILEHPDLKGKQTPLTALFQQILGLCIIILQSWGFTPEEIEWLNTDIVDRVPTEEPKP